MLTPTLVFYCLVGGAVALKLPRGDAAGAAARGGRLLLVALLWPLFFPLLLPAHPARASRPSGAQGRSAHHAQARCAQAALEEALAELGNKLGEPMALETRRVRALGAALESAAARLEDLERVAAQVERAQVDGPAPAEPQLAQIHR